MRAAETDDANFRIRHSFYCWRGHKRTRMIEFAPQPFHVAFIVFRALAVLGFGIVSAATRKIRRRPMLRSWQGPVADRISVHVFVAAKATELVEILFGQNLPALNRLIGIWKRIGHPGVHAQVEI